MGIYCSTTLKLKFPKFGANQSEYTATLKKDDGEYIIKVLVHKVEEDEDE